MFLWRNLSAKSCAAALEALARRLHGATLPPANDKPAAPAKPKNSRQKP